MAALPSLRVLLFQDLPGRWSARSLEHDFAVEGRNVDAVLDRILQLIFAHIDFDRRHGRAPLSAFSAAPSRFWDAFHHAKPHRVIARESPSTGLPYGAIIVSISDERPGMNRPVRPLPLDRFPNLRGASRDVTARVPAVPVPATLRPRRAH